MITSNEAPPGVKVARSRRAVLAGALGGLGLWAVEAVKRVTPARAADNDPVLVGNTHSGSTPTHIVNSTNDAEVIKATSVDGVALRGESQTGTGVSGASSSGSGSGGVSESGVGVVGTSQTGIGMLAASQSNKAVLGIGNGTDAAAGVFEARANSTGVIGVSGEGVLAPAAEPKVGVLGIANQDADSYGVLGRSTDGAGVHGESTNGPGVSAWSGAHAAIYANSIAEPYPGVIGRSGSGGTGVMAYSGGPETIPTARLGVGLHGIAMGPMPRYGVVGQVTGGQAVRGEATNGVALYGTATTGFALDAVGRIRFKTSGVATIPAGAASVVVDPDVNVLSSTFVLLTPKANIGSRALWFTTNATADTFTIRMSSSRSSATKVAWLLVG